MLSSLLVRPLDVSGSGVGGESRESVVSSRKVRKQQYIELDYGGLGAEISNTSVRF